VGAIIIWEPTTEFPSAPLFGPDREDTRRYVLDGQQRLTALSLLMNGGWEITRGDKTIRTSAISYVPETGKFYLSEKKGIDVSMIVKAASGDAESLLTRIVSLLGSSKEEAREVLAALGWREVAVTDAKPVWRRSKDKSRGARAEKRPETPVNPNSPFAGLAALRTR